MNIWIQLPFPILFLMSNIKQNGGPFNFLTSTDKIEQRWLGNNNQRVLEAVNTKTLLKENWLEVQSVRRGQVN